MCVCVCVCGAVIIVHHSYTVYNFHTNQRTYFIQSTHLLLNIFIFKIFNYVIFVINQLDAQNIVLQ